MNAGNATPVNQTFAINARENFADIDQTVDRVARPINDNTVQIDAAVMGNAANAFFARMLQALPGLPDDE